MEKTLLEKAVIFNELYVKPVSKLEIQKVNEIIKTVIRKKKASFSKKFDFVSSYGSLSQQEKIQIERKFPEQQSSSTTIGSPLLIAQNVTGIVATTLANTIISSGSISHLKREIMTVDGATVVVYFNNTKDLATLHFVLRNKKNGKLAFRRVYWRLKTSKQDLKEDFDIFAEDIDLSEESIEIQIDTQLELVESCLMITDEEVR
jgi:hypothetical protein